ncbi:MAG: dockerin type I repeat-containing protein, partial [Proteus hauseri]|nr:dockerin type I repeat-containing protein [Proteus hauseri]
EVGEALKKLITEILEVRILGDVNQDAKVDSADVEMLLRYNAELEELSGEQLEAADVNQDKEAYTNDARMILQYVAEMITKF